MNFYRSNGNWTHGDGVEIPTSPVQKDDGKTIPRVIAEEAYKEYVAQFGANQSFHRLHERGGFSSNEIMILLFERINRIQKNK